jgi:hypothetical protein
MEQNPSWEANSNSASKKKDPPFKNPKGLIMFSQDQATGP